MSKKNDDFFVEKKPWSKVKDQLLGCYLKPYMAKILHTGKPVLYIDCFSGKGKFDDGQPGSPLIALDIIDQALGSSKKEQKSSIFPVFIDLNYADDLRKNLRGHEAEVVSGAYEEKIDDLLKTKQWYNIFLYIDPYGIKALNCSKFDQFAKMPFNSVELLININSFGFIREGCRVFKASPGIEDAFFDDLVEYDSTVLEPSEKSVRILNDIAGGTYWIEIIKQLESKQITAYQAEEYFSREYCERLNRSYKYVLNMPIRIKMGSPTKYRMIYATNHPDGCLLMADNICKRWELLKELQDCGQMSLFKEDVNNNIFDEALIEKYVIEHFSRYSTSTKLTEAEAQFFVKFGVICKTGDINRALKKLENEGKIEIIRRPPVTKGGKISTFMSEEHGKTVSIRWVKG